ncbi:uncharacterized protein BXZ73DRAFT_47596 [Epithele typhae]|uniref:uncharacterized protein n=1 Tax=Epithele typhae TaxID=378194 RepID=UPI002008E131|nr:uncharacterized protein BXZ73DRAFT_47596 [Epithele typhae]KAH9930460.1 hypothetical protein BXZ73DRAFT_47596 [Epithele typhae]
MQAYRGHAGKGVLLSEVRNVSLDPPSIQLMDSGAYTIQEFICKTCDAYLGWKFARAHDSPERWKEGHFVLELDLVAPLDDDGSFPPGPPATAAAAAALLNQSIIPLHKRTMSGPVGAGPGARPMGPRQSVRSLQAAPKSTGPPPPLPQARASAGMGRPGVEDFEDGPFWTPR